MEQHARGADKIINQLKFEIDTEELEKWKLHWIKGFIIVGGVGWGGGGS